MNAFVAFSTLLAAANAAYVAPFAAYGARPAVTAYGAVAAPAYAAAAPAAYAAAPAVAAAPALPAALAAPSSQFQAQDELGNINYGYTNINSAKQEVGNTYGGVTGSYSYVDAYGIPQRVDYIADALGFRVKATNLPVAPAAQPAPLVALPEAPVYTGVAPEPVQDTPEVLAAKAEHAAAHEAARAKRSVVPAATAPLAYGLNYGSLPYAAGFAAPYAAGYGLNYGLNYGYAAGLAAPYAAATYAAPAAIAAPAYAAAAPVAYAAAAPVAETISAPAAREAILTEVKLNPGHAVAYRVD